VAPREQELKRLVAAALAAGLSDGDVAALRSLMQLDRAAGDPTAAWFLSVREVLGAPVAEAFVARGDALLYGSVGEGPPWRAVNPLSQLVEARWFAPGEDGEQSLKLRIGQSTHVLRERPDDAFTTGLRAFADALLERVGR